MNTTNFLSKFGNIHCFQIFADREAAKEIVKPKNFHSDFKSVATSLVEHNQKGAGVYFVVQETDGAGRKLENIKRVRAIFVDLDGAPLQPALDKLMPHIVVNTRPESEGRHHLYWFVDDVALDEYVGLSKRLAIRLNGDVQCAELTRVARVPGFYNMKEELEEPFMVSAQWMHDRKVTKYDLISAFKLNEISLDSPQNSKRTSLEALKENPVGAGERHETLFAIARKHAALGMGEFELEVLLRAANSMFDPPMSEERLADEIKRIVAQVKMYEGGHLGLIQFETTLDEEDEPVEPEEEAFAGLTDQFAKEAPGLVGELAKAITDSAIWPLPKLALQTALVAMSGVKGRDYKGYFGGYCNLYTVGLAEAARGKGYNIDCLDSILSIAGVEHLIAGKLISGASFATAFARTGGMAISIQDEAGQYLDQVLNPRMADKHSSALRENLLAMFNAKRKVRGSEYSSRGGTPQRIDIENPWLTLYLMSTPKTMFASINRDHAADGFLSRLLLFEHIDPPGGVKERRNWSAKDGLKVDQKLIEELYNYRNQFHAGPKRIEFAPGGEELFVQYVDQIDRLVLGTENPIQKAIRGRLVEYFDKLIIILADRAFVTPEVMEYAYNLARFCNNDLIRAMNMHTIQTQASVEMDALLTYIRGRGKLGATRAEIARRFQGIRRVNREEHLKSLIEAHLVEIRPMESRDSGRILDKFVATIPRRE